MIGDVAKSDRHLGDLKNIFFFFMICHCNNAMAIATQSSICIANTTSNFRMYNIYDKYVTMCIGREATAFNRLTISIKLDIAKSLSKKKYLKFQFGN